MDLKYTKSIFLDKSILNMNMLVLRNKLNSYLTVALFHEV